MKNKRINTKKFIFFNFTLDITFTILLLICKYIIYMITGNNSYGFSVIIFLFLIPTSFLLFCMKRFHKCYGIELFSMNISLKILFLFQILLIIFLLYIFINLVKPLY